MSSDVVLGRIPASDLPAIAERYRAGESLKVISEEYGVTYQGLRLRLEKWALAGLGDTDHQQLVTEYLVDNAIEAKEKMVSSPDMLSLARAREETKYWLWMLERRRPKLYGQKTEHSTDTRIEVIIHRDTAQPPQTTMIDADRPLLDHASPREGQHD